MYGLTPGNKIGPYVLDGSIGAGGQGSVWKAHHETVPGEVALKIIPVRGSPMTMVERVRRETEALVKLGQAHPSVVACQGLVEDDASGVLAVAMEMVDGQELSVVLQDPRCDLALRETILTHVAKALAFLHQQGIVHRDLKPQNILVQNRFWASPDDPSTVKLVDFGIATLLGNPKPLTEVGTVVGTPAFMPPERIDPMFWETAQGRPTEDVFAFGVVAYEAFFGRHPSGVKDDGTLSVYAEKYRAVARSVEAWPQLPPGHRWSAALRGALTLKRGDRIPDGTALVAAIGSAPPAAAPQKTQVEAPHAAPVGGAGPKTEAASIHDVPPGAAAAALYPTPAPAPAPYTAAPALTPAPPSPHGGPPPMAYAPPPPPARGAGGAEGGNTALKALIGVIVAGIVIVPLVFLLTRSSSDTPDAPPPATPAGTGSEVPIAPPSPPPGDAPPVTGTTTPLPPPVGGTPPKGTGTVVVGPGKTSGPATTTAAPPTTTAAPPTTTATGGRPKIGGGIPPTPPTTGAPPPPTTTTAGGGPRPPKIKTH